MADKIPVVLGGTSPNFSGVAQLLTADRLAGVVNEKDFADDSLVVKRVGQSPTSLPLAENTLLGNVGSGIAALTTTDLAPIMAGALGLTGKGQLVAYNGTTFVALAPGTNGQLVSFDSTTASGFAAVNAASGGGSDNLGNHTATQDLVMADNAITGVEYVGFENEIDIRNTTYQVETAGAAFVLSYNNSTKLAYDGGREEFNLLTYPNTRDDTATTAIENFLYTAVGGQLRSAPIEALSIPGTLKDLQDVDSNMSANDNDILTYVSGEWIAQAGNNVNASLGQLTDVAVSPIPELADPQEHILTYDGTSWASGPMLLSLCQDFELVDGATPSDGQILRYSTSANKWRNVSAASIQDNLGNHTATQDLNLADNRIVSVSSIELEDNFTIGAEEVLIREDFSNTTLEIEGVTAGSVWFALNYLTGTVTLPGYTSVRDDFTSSPVANVLSTSNTGQLLAAPIARLPFNSYPQTTVIEVGDFTVPADAAGKLYLLSSNSTQTVTFDLESTIPIAIGTRITFVQVDTGTIDFDVADAGVRISGPGNARTMNGQWSTVDAIKVASNTWVLAGDVIA